MRPIDRVRREIAIQSSSFVDYSILRDAILEEVQDTNDIIIEVRETQIEKESEVTMIASPVISSTIPAKKGFKKKS